jgi:hypothetical protein
LALGDVSLNAGLRVENGTVTFSGGATAGLPQGSVTRKQTLDIALANDFDPAAVSAIYTDAAGPYTGAPAFPMLADVVGGGETRTWEQMYNQEGLHITSAPYVPLVGGGLGGSTIDASIGEPIGGGLRTFCVPYPCGTVYTSPGGVQSFFNLTIDVANKTATLVASGIIVFDNFGSGRGLTIGKKSGSNQLDVIQYTGSAVIFVEDGSPSNCGPPPCAGRSTIAADVKTPPASYPTAADPLVYPPPAGTINNLAFVAEQIGLARGADDSSLSGAAQLTITGLFFAQSQVFSCKQNEVVGSLFSRIVTMSCNVPKIAAVRNMSRFLPTRLIGADSGPGTLTVLRWREGTQ